MQIANRRRGVNVVQCVANRCGKGQVVTLRGGDAAENARHACLIAFAARLLSAPEDEISYLPQRKALVHLHAIADIADVFQFR